MAWTVEGTKRKVDVLERLDLAVVQAHVRKAQELALPSKPPQELRPYFAILV